MNTVGERGPAKNVLVDVWLLATLARALVDDALAGSPMSADEFALYGLVVDLGPLTAADLARATGLPSTTLSGILARCERRGELERVPSPTDRRSVLLRLTEQGMAVYQAPLPGLAALLARIDAAVEGSLDDVRQGLQRLDDALRQVRGVEERPYRLAAPDAPASFDYPGMRLTARQQREVLDYVDWIRHRDAR
jgi:DNA-binding MarR family transcriptional regulator